MRIRAPVWAALLITAAVALALLLAPLPAAAGSGHATPAPGPPPGRLPLAFDTPNATQLFPNGSVSGTVTGGTPAVYRVLANRSDVAPETLSVALGTFGGLFPYGWVEVYDPYQVLVDEKVTTYDGQVNVSRFIVGETGFYLLVVSSTATYDWSLTVNVTVGGASPTDDDNALANATVITNSSGWLIDSVTDWTDLYDTYRFDLEVRPGGADALVVNLSGVGPADLDLYVYHIVGSTAVIDSYSITPFALEFAGAYPGASGPFYVRVLSYSGSGAYNLTWLVLDKQADANGRPADATPLPLGPSLNNLSRWDERDVFRIDAPANTTVNVSFHTVGWNATTRLPDLQAVLLDASLGRVTWSFLFDPDERIDAVLPADGVYYLDVYPVDIAYFLSTSMSFDYTMDASVDPPPALQLAAWNGSMVEDTPASFDLWAVVPPDPAGETIGYEVVSVEGPVSAQVTGGHTLSVTPLPDAWGNATVSLRASDRWRSVDVELPLQVAAVNDPPRLRPGAGQVSFDEDGTGVVDANVTALDPEGDAFTIVSASASAPIVASLQGNAVVLSAPPDFAGSGTAVLTLRDERGAQSNVTLQVTVRPVNDAPRIVGSLGPLVIQEDATAAGATFSLAGLAQDPDGDPLTYTARGAPGLAVLVVNETLTLVPSPDFFGDVEITVEASDGVLNATRTVPVHVAAVNDPPVIHAPTSQPVAREGLPFRLDITATDVDNAPSQLSYSFWLDGEAAVNATGNASFEHTFGYDDAGFHVVRVTVTDGNLSSSLDISVFVSETNRPPQAQVLTPDGSSFSTGEAISITGRGTDPDGDPLTYRWIVDGTLAGQSETAALTGLPAGPHTAVLFVSDGQETAAAEISFTVTAASPGPGAALAVAALIAAGAVAALAVRRRM